MDSNSVVAKLVALQEERTNDRLRVALRTDSLTEDQRIERILAIMGEGARVRCESVCLRANALLATLNEESWR